MPKVASNWVMCEKKWVSIFLEGMYGYSSYSKRKKKILLLSLERALALPLYLVGRLVLIWGLDHIVIVKKGNNQAI